MSLWLDTRDGTRNEGRTHALVIGVSSYRHPRFGVRSVESPASSALAFARWLRDSYSNPEAPLATVRLLLSPSEHERRALPEFAENPPRFRPALRDEVEKALFEWQDDCRGNPGDVAILFASGHGVQHSKEEASVLLEDFAATRNAMTFSLDVGQVHRGMAGADLPQTQLYFVDACRESPVELRRFRNLGQGVGLPDPSHMEDRRCAPIWFSASPGTNAYGQADLGTLFSQALLGCLGGLAAISPTPDRSQWHITTMSLSEALERTVGELAARYDLRQTVVAGGLMRSAVVHVFPSAPQVDLTIQLDPAAAGAGALADLWDGDRSTTIWHGAGFTSGCVESRIPAGLYSLDIRLPPETASFKPKVGFPLVVEPPRTDRVVRLA